MAAPLRILLLAHGFNGLTQRLFVELRELGHHVSVELDIADSVTEEAVAMFAPDLLVAPFLKRRIPESVWSRRVCLVVHPGPPGDRGPAALDWAVLKRAPRAGPTRPAPRGGSSKVAEPHLLKRAPRAGPARPAPSGGSGKVAESHLLESEPRWGVTVLQATGDFDAGPVWASASFEMRAGATKSSLYRHEVTEAAVQAVRAALARFEPGCAGPARAAESTEDAADTERGWQPAVPRDLRRIDWHTLDTADLLRRARAADGAPGIEAVLFGRACRLFDVHPAAGPPGAAPGQATARRGPALRVACRDGAVWVGHVRGLGDDATPSPLKLPATRVFAAEAANLRESPVPLMRDALEDGGEWDELRYTEFGPSGATVGWLTFDFHNGAMSERQCRRLQQALTEVRERATQVLVLAGGREFFSNGIHLHDIEAAAHEPGDSAADASWRNIEAMNDAVLAVLTATDRVTVAALRGNAGAGGCFLALAADEVWAHPGAVLNPHYRNMGNLHGSEYWTFTLPRRVGDAAARELMRRRLPMSARQAQGLGLVDACLGADGATFDAQARLHALALAASPALAERIAAKAAARLADEAKRPLARYRAAEMTAMQRNFYGFDPSYHVARHHFVHRKPHAWTPRHLALHR